MTNEQLQEILKKHKLWLYDKANGKRADLHYADLSYANLSYADLRDADLRYADLSSANLSYADLSRANLRNADLSSANLIGANLHHADLYSANLSFADLSCADLCNADLRHANLSSANLSSVKNLLSTCNYLDTHFERTDSGYIVYKTFNSQYNSPPKWVIKPGSIIEESVNPCRTNECGCGINVAPFEWVKTNYDGEIYKLLIRWEWAAGIVVPYNTDGKIRCEKAEIIGVVK